MKIGIHTISGGGQIGESIVLELPDGQIGVIDCYAPIPKSDDRPVDTNPTLRFLVNRFKCKRLAFVAFTHPHQDHGQGLVEILKHFEGNIDQYWIFSDSALSLLLKNLKHLADRGRLREEQDTGLQRRAWLKQLMELTPILLKAAREGRIRKFCRNSSFKIAGVQFHFRGSDSVAHRYAENLAKDVARCAPSGGSEPREHPHNEICAAIIVEYGKGRFVLGGDMEKEAWEHVLKDVTEENVSIRCRMIKVSHHGSENGYAEDLYLKISNQGKSKYLAVVTPYGRCRSPLPTRKGIEVALTYASEVITTNAEAARSSLMSSRARVPRMHAPAMIAVKGLASRGLIDPSLRREATESPVPSSLTMEDFKQIYNEPSIADCLPDNLVRNVGVKVDTDNSEDLYRVSLYFNSKGDELKRLREVGPRAGTIELERK